MLILTHSRHEYFMKEAISLSQQAEGLGNLPIGAVITLHDQIISRGMNAIWSPSLALTRHAEMEALRSVPPDLWSHSRAMTLYTTLEPCVMCAGAILLHSLGEVVFGATDPNGGVGACLESLPPYFKRQLELIRWTGPTLPSSCDPLYHRVMDLEAHRQSSPSIDQGNT